MTQRQNCPLRPNLAPAHSPHSDTSASAAAPKRNPPTTKTTQPNRKPQQTANASTQTQRQLSVLNARIGNANLAQKDLITEVGNTVKTLTVQIAALQKENADLKAKVAAPKPQ